MQPTDDEVIIDESKTHAKLSPSSSKRWMTCAGSVNFIKQLNIKDRTTKYAAEGTVAHKIGDLCLSENLEPESFLGKTMEADGFKFTVNQNMVDAVQQYVDYVYEQIDMADTLGDSQTKMSVEVWCALDSLGIPGLDGGTSDCVLINKDHLFIEVIDYKHGQGVAVEVIHNTQAMHYGLGALIESGISRKEAKKWKVILTIVQPRVYHKDGRIRSWEITGKDLFDWQDNELIPKAKATLAPDAPLVPSDEGCRFCDASGQCTALYEKTQEMAVVDFEDIELTNDEKFPPIPELTVDQKIKVMEHAKAIKAFITGVENQIKLEMDSGSTEYKDHFKLVRTQPRRKFTNDAFDQDFSPLFDHLERDDLFVEKEKGIGEVEKALKAKLKEEGVKGFTKLAKEIIEDVTTRPKGEIVVAPIADQREEVQASAQSDFADLGD